MLPSMWTPQPHQPWFWSIIKQENPRLRAGRWWIGKCYDVLRRHQDWFKSPTQNLNNSRLHIGTVADLIDQNSNNWKPDLIWATYPYPQWSEILKIPLSKTSSVSDKLLWKHSNNGEFTQERRWKRFLCIHWDDGTSFFFGRELSKQWGVSWLGLCNEAS